MTSYSPSKTCRRNKRCRGLCLLNSVLLVAVIASGLLYLFQTNSLVGCSYKIRQHEERLEELQTAHQELTMELAQWHSPANLERVVYRLGMVEAGAIIYLDTEKAVAAKAN